MVQPKFEPDTTPAGQASLRQSVESEAVTKVVGVRRVVEPTEGMVDEVPGCRADGTCGGRFKQL